MINRNSSASHTFYRSSSDKSHRIKDFKKIFFKIFFFGCGSFLKSLLNLLQYCFCLVLDFWSQGMRDLSFLTRDRTCTPCIGRQSLNHWTTREVSRILDELREPSAQGITLKDKFPIRKGLERSNASKYSRRAKYTH